MDPGRQSRNHLVLVVVLVFVIEDPIVENENEDEDENVCRICVNLHDCSKDGEWNSESPAGLKLWSGHPPRLTAGDDLDDLEPVAGLQGAGGKLGGGDGLAIVFDDDAAGQKRLRLQKLLERARQPSLGWLAICQDHAFSRLRCGPLDWGV